VQARVTGQKGRALFAEAVRWLAVSEDRVSPPCPRFGRACCANWGHIAYGAQLLLKQDVLMDQLSRVAGLSDEQILACVAPVLPADALLGYRYQQDYSVTENQLCLAGQPLGTDDVCALVHDALAALGGQLDLELQGISAVQLRQNSALLPDAQDGPASDGSASDQLPPQAGQMVILRSPSDEAPALETDLPVSINLILGDDEPINLIGDTHSRYTVRGRTLRVTAGGYLRPNVSQWPLLLDTVLAMLQPQAGERILDLYGGVGLFSAFIAPRCAHVTLIENYPPSMSDAELNLADLPNIDLIEGEVEAVLVAPDVLEGPFAAVVVDPPAEGLSGAALDAIVALSPARLVYVSSDAATFSRDTKRLLAQGYRLAQVQPLDLAPQTAQIDLVARFVTH
jgi:23S rRNA (uracil1939-C5)-methyltransferase